MSKSTKHLRPCPALGRPITSAECGSGRGSRYDCPEECPFFPFTRANYDLHGEIESRLIQAAFVRIRQDWSQAEQAETLRAFNRSEGQANEILRNHAFFAWRFHVRRSADGRTTGERWLADAKSGLSNDERVLLAGMNAMQPAVFEMERIIDAQTVEGTDLLDGRPMRMVDRSNASTAIRYGAVLCWVYPMRHYTRISGGALFVPEIGQLSADEIVREVIRHLGGPAGEVEERAWLAENFAHVCQALGAVGLARRQDCLAAVDGTFIKTDYRPSQSANLLAKILKRAALLEEDPSAEEIALGFQKSFSWLKEAPGSQQHEGELALALPGELKVGVGSLILGRLLVAPDRFRIEALSRERHQDLRSRFERIAAGKAEFLSERADDLPAQQRLASQPSFDASLVPPRLRENPQRLTFISQHLEGAPRGPVPTAVDIFRQQYAVFADQPSPALEGRTPRAAAADPAMRPSLIRLMKTHIRGADTQRRHKGIDLDLNPLLADLGLHELISDPPPLGVASADKLADEDSGEDGRSILEDFPLSEGGNALRRERPPLSEREAIERLKTLPADYDLAADAIDLQFPDLFDFCYEFTDAALNENEQVLLEMGTLRACYLFAPPDGSECLLDLDRIAHEARAELVSIAEAATRGSKKSDPLQAWREESSQPAALDVLMSDVLTMAEGFPRKKRPGEAGTLLIFAVLKAIVAELAQQRG